MTKDVKDHFKDFLEEHEVWEKYIEYLNTKVLRAKEINFNAFSRVIFRVIFDADYILGAFNWEHTPEGHEFWAKLNEKWLKRLKEIDSNHE